MLVDETVFVIGAGASAEVGLPLGQELAVLVSELLTMRENRYGASELGDTNFTHSLVDFCGTQKIEAYLTAASEIRKRIVGVDSIDRFIDRYQENEAIRHLGKAAIVHLISAREKLSGLHIDERSGDQEIAPGVLDETWYWVFQHILFDDLIRSKVETAFDKLKIVTFNYDRCIEHFLIRELMRSFSLDRGTAALLVKNKLKIWHPYGTLGTLRDQGGDVDFGEDLSSRSFELAERIRTFSEEIDDSDDLEATRLAIATAPVVVFLGFGFNSQNIKLLGYPDGRGRKQQRRAVLATAYLEPDNGRQQIALRAQELCGHNTAALVHNQKCVDLLREYRRLLSQ